jgi:uncharacterized protein (UPF0333 family)
VKSSILQRGSAVIALLLVVIVLVIGVAFAAMTYINYANYGNRTEQSLIAIRDNNKNIYATYTQKVMEAAQVPEMARDDMIKVVTAAVQGRYGNEGSRATFQVLREQNPNIDPKLYSKIQQLIEGGRNDFQNGQTKQLDAVRSYKTALGNVIGGFVLHLAGYPKIDLKEFEIVTTDRTEAVFKDHKESGPLQIRPAASK